MNTNNFKFTDFLYTDIYLISVINPSNAVVISCRHADSFLNIGDNVFINNIISAEERQQIYRRLSSSQDSFIIAAIANRLAFIITDMSSSLNCFVLIFPRLPYKYVISLIKNNRFGEIEIFKSAENEHYEYQLHYNYSVEEVYQLLSKLLSDISLYRHTSETVFRSQKNCFQSSERVLQKIIATADFIGCKLYVKETNFKPYNMINLNLCSLCDYSFCVFLLARRISENHSATLSFTEQLNILSFVFTIDCYTPPNLSSADKIKFIDNSCPEIYQCKKSSNFNNCVFNYKIEYINDKVELTIKISTYVNDNSAYGLKAPF